MANDYLDIATVLKFNDSDLSDGIINDILDDTPVLAAMAAKSIPGYLHKYLKRTQAPVVGFRAANDGRENDQTEMTQVTNTLTILDAMSTIDVAVAQGDERGWQSAVSDEAMSHLRAAFAAFEDQLLNNTDGTNGFTGLPGLSGLDAIADTMVYGAGGVTGTDQSSVYGIKTGPMDAMTVWGQNGVINIGDTREERIAGATTGFLNAYVTPCEAWGGLQIGGAYSIGRLANLDGTATLTDDLMSELLNLFPARGQPDFFVMAKRDRKELQQSRTATNATGAPAPRPTEYEGIPIVVSDHCSITEAVVS